jgi:putative ABC transport system permease protein
MSLVIVGALIGLALATAAARVLAGLLLGTLPFDPAIFCGTAVLFAAIGLAACAVPVLRAARIDAMEALRFE